MKVILFLGVLGLAVTSMAAKQIQCEAITIKNSVSEDLESRYSTKLVSINLDNGGEGSADIDASTQTNITVTEDNYLKGLYSVLFTRGASPISDADGMVMTALLKKDSIVTNEDLDQNLISSIHLKDGEKAQSFGLLNRANLDAVSILTMTNKLSTALREANLKLVGNDRIFFERQMMIQSAMSLLMNEKVKKILAEKFTEGEVIMMGMNLLCIEKKSK